MEIGREGYEARGGRRPDQALVTVNLDSSPGTRFQGTGKTCYLEASLTAAQLAQLPCQIASRTGIDAASPLGMKLEASDAASLIRAVKVLDKLITDDPNFQVCLPAATNL